MKVKLINIILLAIFGLAVLYRVSYYGDLRLSIANNDTATYISSSKAPAFSWESFAGRRLFTTNLLFKLANDDEKCKVIALSLPALGLENSRALQPCFDRIVILQNILSIAGWCILAWITARWLNNSFLKILSVVTILLFGFSPLIAEWDSVLSSESLSLSLFPIVFAVLQEIVFKTISNKKSDLVLANKLLVPLWLFVFLLWVFVRDVHLYAIIATLAVTIPLLFINKIRKQTITLPIIIILTGFFLFGNYTAHHSTRWQPSLTHILDWYVFPHPTRVDFFTKLGMPDDRSGFQYTEWFNAHGISSYGKFLVAHPGFVTATILERSEYFKSNFSQTYYPSTAARNSKILMVMQEMSHPETYAIYAIDIFLLVTLYKIAIKQRNKRALAWSYLGTWMFIYSGISLFVSYIGDLDGVGRHVFPSVELFRLFLWVFLFPILDMAGSEAVTMDKNQEE